MIRVFIGTAPKWAAHEPILEYSIREHCSQPVEINFMRAGEHGLQPSGCTGFTNFRFAVPELAGFQGHAIYLDIDMLVLADISELWEYRKPGRFVTPLSGGTEVSVIDCTMRIYPPASEIHRHKKWELERITPMLFAINALWNVEDELKPGTKLLHFTDLRQDWINGEHNSREAMELLNEYKKNYASRPHVGVA